MRVRLAAVVILAAAGVAHAGERSGVVRDAATGAPVPGAMILAGDDVVIGDDAGGFTVDDAAGVIMVHAPGYADATVELGGAAGGALVVRLAPSDANVEIIEMEGEAPDLATAPAHGLDADDLRSMPGAMGDALRAVQALPEVARVPFSLGGLAVRGMSPRDTDAYLDGVPIPQAFHAGGIAAVIPSATIDRLELVPGAVDARYGGVLGGVVLLHSREPRGDGVNMRGELSPLDAQAGGDAPLGGGAIAIGVRRAHLADVVAPFLSEDTLVPEYSDAQVRWRRDLAGGRLSTLGFYARSTLLLEEGSLGTETMRAAAGWTRTRRHLTSSVLGWVGRDRLDITADKPIPPYNRSQLHTSDTIFGARADTVRDFTWGHVAGGVDLDLVRLGPGRILFGPSEGWLQQVGVWAEHRWVLAGGRLTVKSGVRADVRRDGTTISPIDLAPRLLVVEEMTSRVKMRAAAALERRPIGIGSRALIATRPELIDAAGGVPRPRAVHIQAGVDLELMTGLTVTPGLFLIHARDVELPETVLETTEGGDPVVSPFGAVARELMAEQLGEDFELDGPSQPYGRGRSQGVDLAVRLERGRWRGLLSYTRSTSERRDSLRSRTPSWKPYILDQPDNLSVALSVKLGRWRAGARFRYVSGGPVPYEGIGLPERLPDYLDLSMRVERGWRRGWGELHGFVDVQNVTNRKNVEDILAESSMNREILGLPILPFAGIEYRPPAERNR